MILSRALNFWFGTMGTVKDDKEEEDSLDVPHRM